MQLKAKPLYLRLGKVSKQPTHTIRAESNLVLSDSVEILENPRDAGNHDLPQSACFLLHPQLGV